MKPYKHANSNLKNVKLNNNKEDRLKNTWLKNKKIKQNLLIPNKFVRKCMKKCTKTKWENKNNVILKNFNNKNYLPCSPKMVTLDNVMKVGLNSFWNNMMMLIILFSPSKYQNISTHLNLQWTLTLIGCQ